MSRGDLSQQENSCYEFGRGPIRRWRQIISALFLELGDGRLDLGNGDADIGRQVNEKWFGVFALGNSKKLSVFYSTDPDFRNYVASGTNSVTGFPF